MRESELLAHIYQRTSGNLSPEAPVRVGPGDDCAVVDLASGSLLTVDHLIEGRHFPAAPSAPSPDLIARKAVARSISDIAAMGGRPVCALAAACLPQGYSNAVALFDAVHHWGRHWNCPVVGGDIAINPGPLALTITVIGAAHPKRGPVLRSTAQLGDDVYITGRAGNSFHSGRHLTFEPRLDEAAFLCDHLGDRLHAMIDVSDGIGRDAARIADASNVGIELTAADLPLHADCPSWESALHDGEDYELLFCAAPGVAIPATIGPQATPVTRIGRIIAGSEAVAIAPDARRIDIRNMGWDHQS